MRLPSLIIFLLLYLILVLLVPISVSIILSVLLAMMYFAQWADKKNGAEGLIMIESTSVSVTRNGWSSDWDDDGEDD